MVISAVVFDFFGTLTPSIPTQVWDRHAAASAEPLGIATGDWRHALDTSFAERATGSLGDLVETFRTLAARCGITPDEDALAAACAARFESQRALFGLRADAVSTLTRLRARGLRLGLLSDCTVELAESWSSLPLAQLVDERVLSCEVGRRKPDPVLFKSIAELLDTPPHECLYVGDGGGDELTGASAAGMHAFMLRADDWHVNDAHQREDSWPGPFLPNLAAVLPLLDRLQRAVSGVTGVQGRYVDPLWRTATELTPLEQALLRTATLRRLHLIAHAGAASITTAQTYSRLEHSLGVFSLAAHFRPADQLLRAAALLHDIGHLPFSHTLEGVAGLNHHALGISLLHEAPVADALEAHGFAPEDIADLLDGNAVSPLCAPRGLLGLDHLDSYVRSARCAARLDLEPERLLSAVEIVDDAVSTDASNAEQLVELVCGEARAHTSWDNVAPSAALQRLVRRLLDTGLITPAGLARMTDAQLWMALDTAAETRDEAELLRLSPHLLRIGTDAPGQQAAWDFSLRKIYSSAPLVDGQPIEITAPHLAKRLADLRKLPLDYRVGWEAPQPPGQAWRPRA